MRVLSIIFLSLFLTACSSDIDKSATLYQTELPIDVTVSIPKQIEYGQEYTIKVSFMQGSERIIDADFVHFEVVKQDGSINFGMSEATSDGNGIYSKQMRFDSEGLYFLKIHAGNKGSTIMPTRQIIVGSLTDNDQLFLQQNIPIPETNHEGHH